MLLSILFVCRDWRSLFFYLGTVGEITTFSFIFIWQFLCLGPVNSATEILCQNYILQPAVSYCLGIFYFFCSAGHIGMANMLYPSKSDIILFLLLRSGCIYCLDVVSFCIQKFVLPLISLRFPSWSTMVYFDFSCPYGVLLEDQKEVQFNAMLVHK
jgi:hypothetical protein